MATTLKIKLSKLMVEDVPGEYGRARVDINVNGIGQKTADASTSEGKAFWDEEFHMDIPNGSHITFILFVHHFALSFREARVLGQHSEPLVNAIMSGASTERRMANSTVCINFTINRLPHTAPSAAERQTRAAALRQQKRPALHRVGAGMQLFHDSGLVDATLQVNSKPFRPDRPASRPNVPIRQGGLLSTFRSMDDEAWKALLANVSIFVNLVTNVAEIHPLAKAVVTVLLAGYKVFKAQADRDDKFKGLLDSASSAFALANKLRAPELESHTSTLKILTLQLTDCGFFIRDYYKQPGLLQRTVNSIFRGQQLDSKIQEYQDNFSRIRAIFCGESAAHIEVRVVRMEEKIKRIGSALDLSGLPYIGGVRFNQDRTCLLGTRELILEKIVDWVNDRDKPRTLVLTAKDGFGKSAIAHSVAHTFDGMKRLGSSCFFPQLPSGDPEVALKLFPTITRDLADFDTAWRNSLTRTAGTRAIQCTTSLQEQFTKFILQPATSSENAPVYFGPVLIVIDGLEQCGSEDSQERRELLSILSTKLTMLPPNFRFLITTRPSPDISRALCQEGTNVEHWDLHTEIKDKQTAEDIAAFLEAELSLVFRGHWPKYREKLANNLEKNFSSVALACDAIKKDANPVDYITQFLQRADEGGWNAAAIRQSISQHIPFFLPRASQRGPPVPLLPTNPANRPSLPRQPTDSILQPPERISLEDSMPMTPALTDQGSVGMPSPDSESFDSAPSSPWLFPQPHFDEPASYEGDSFIQPGKPIGIPVGPNSYAMSGDDATGYNPSFPDPKPHNPPVYRTSDPHRRPTPPMRVLRAPPTTHSSAASSFGGWA